MRRLSDFEQLHELLEGDAFLELESPCADVREVLLRDEVTNTVEQGLQTFLVHFAVDCVQLKHLHECLSLRCFDCIFMRACVFIL